MIPNLFLIRVFGLMPTGRVGFVKCACLSEPVLFWDNLRSSTWIISGSGYNYFITEYLSHQELSKIRQMFSRVWHHSVIWLNPKFWLLQFILHIESPVGKHSASGSPGNWVAARRPIIYGDVHRSFLFLEPQLDKIKRSRSFFPTAIVFIFKNVQMT